MKKKIVTIATASLFALGLGSCGPSEAPSFGVPLEILDLEDIQEYNRVNGTVEISFWHAFAGQMERDLDRFISNFETDMEKLGLDITINAVSQGTHINNVRQNINLAMSAGAAGRATLPTIAAGMPSHALNNFEMGIHVPLEGFVDSDNPLIGLNDESIEDIIEGFWSEGFITFNGQTELLSMPWSKSTEVMYYNSDFIIPFIERYLDSGINDEANIRQAIGVDQNVDIFTRKSLEPVTDGRRFQWVDATWTQLWFISEYVNRNLENLRGNFGFSDNLGVGVDGRPVLLDSRRNTANTIMYQWSGMSITEVQEDGRGRIVIDTDANEEAINYLLAHHNANRFSFPSGFASGPFTQGNAVISIGSSAGGVNLYSSRFTTGVTNNPQSPNGNDAHSMSVQQGPSISIISANSSNIERLAGWLFMRYMSSSEVSALWAAATGYMPVRRSSMSILEDYFNENEPTGNRVVIPRIQVASARQADYFINDEVFDGSHSVREDLHDHFMVQIFNNGLTFTEAVGMFHARFAIHVRQGRLTIATR